MNVKAKYRLGIPALIASLLILLNYYVASTRIGHRVEIYVFEFLQRQLSTFESSERLPILVVDISKLPGGKDQATSRESLASILKAIAAQRPAAIAVDIDFSPDESGWITDDDPKFFDSCLELKRKTGVSIFLGVYRTQLEPSNTWLGLSKYKELAAAAIVKGGDPKRMARWIQAEGISEKLPTLSAALASAYLPTLPRPSRWVARIVEGRSDGQHGIEEIENDLTFGQTLVNYSKLEQIQHETLPTLTPSSIEEAGEMFRGRMVILGDATIFTDPFIVPGRDKAVAGVYLEASHAYTLAIQPLYEFTPLVRLSLDLLISSLLILGTEWIRFVTVKKRPGLRFHKWKTRFITCTIISVIIGGVLLINWLHIMWLDFYLVIFAVLLHPSLETRLNVFWKSLRRQTSLERT